MKLTKPTLNKDSTNVELAKVISEACMKGYLDAKKGVKERADAAILKAVAKSVMSRHKSAIVHAYKAGFAQGKQHK